MELEPQQPINILWERLAEADPLEVAARAAVPFDAQDRLYRVSFLGAEHAVDPEARTVTRSSGDGGYAATLICVQYLLTAQDESLAGERVNPVSLPHGEFFFRGPHALPTGTIEAAFGTQPQLFQAAAEAMGGKPLDMADAAAEFRALPRVPVAVTLWIADDEFPARAQMLVDKHADHQLPLDALWLLFGVLAKAIVAAGEAEEGETSRG
jgi:hypothetical protein